MKNLTALPVYVDPRSEEVSTAYIQLNRVVQIEPAYRGCFVTLLFGGDSSSCWTSLTSEEMYQLVCDSEEHPGKEDA